MITIEWVEKEGDVIGARIECQVGDKTRDVERVLVEATVKAFPNRVVASKMLGIGIRTLQRKLKRWSNKD